MTKYLINRLLRGLLSIVIVVGIVMVLIYTCLDRTQIFARDSLYSRFTHNEKEVYKYTRWEEYGYLDYVTYADYMLSLLKSGEITQETYDSAIVYGTKPSNAVDADPDTNVNENAKEYVQKFLDKYRAEGYQVKALDTIWAGKKQLSKAQLFVYKDIPLINRLWSYVTGIFSVEHIYQVEGDIVNADGEIEERRIEFTLFDPAYGGAFSPAIMGMGTHHRYLLYFDNQFPFIHQNLFHVNLGKSYTIEKGIDVFTILNKVQGNQSISVVTYPTGMVKDSADDLHTLTYSAGSLQNGGALAAEKFNNDYTALSLRKDGMSKLGYSFVIGLISVIMAYLLAIPLGTLMARKKDKLFDKLGTFYIVFIIAVPSLAYIFLFRAIGTAFGLPAVFDTVNPTIWMYVLPIVSLALPSVANLMKWLRRYMIDQMNSDYVKFARSGGLSEGEIFRKHVLKNAIIPIVHGIPGSVLGSLVGAIITESVYVVPGAGNMLTKAINQYDNGVIVGMTLFYALISVISVILGDLLMALMDPRISFTSKRR